MDVLAVSRLSDKEKVPELRKLGFQLSKTTVSIVLESYGIPPAPERGRQGSSWRVFFNHYKDQFLAREECLDKVIILNKRRLRRVLHEYVAYYDALRPQQGPDQDSPNGILPASQQGTVRYQKVLGGIIRDHDREAG